MAPIDEAFDRLVAEDAAGAMVGYGQINHMPSQFHPRKFSLDLLVDPACQRRGIGSALYGRMLEELASRDALLARAEAASAPLAAGDVDGDGRAELLVAAENFVRALRLDPHNAKIKADYERAKRSSAAPQKKQ